MLYNYIVDFYGVFRQDISENRHEPNFRFIKTKYLVEHPNKYDKLVFGSSRVGKILANHQDPAAYNMYYSEGVPAEFLVDIKTLFACGVKPDSIFIGLDIFSFRILPEKHQTQLLRLPYNNDAVENLSTYLQMLVDPPKIGFPEYEIATNFDYENSGSPLHFAVDSLINKDTLAHIQHRKFENIQLYRGKRIAKTIDELKQIQSICQENNIPLIIFMNPVYAGTYVQYPFEEISKIKTELAQLGGFIDYSGFNKITVNRLNYYESSHYRYFIGDSIWMDLNGKSPFSIHKSVNAANVAAYLTKEKEAKAAFEHIAIKN